MFDSIEEALQHIADHEVAVVDLKLTGLPGQWLHLGVPAGRFSRQHFEEGIGFDGSSGAGFGRVGNSDVVAIPRPETAFLDPFHRHATLSFICDVATADTREPFAHDPRQIARRAVAMMEAAGIADTAMMAPEFEFHVFDEVRIRNDPYRFGVTIRTAEVHSDGTTPPLRHKAGYLRIPPADQLSDLRGEIAAVLESIGVPVRYHHHEVGAPGQCEIETELADLVTAADRAMMIKYVVKNVARRHGRLATFMPKPVYCEAGNGMHVHQRLERNGRNLFFDERGKNYGGLSDLALHYIAGLLSHGASLTGLTNPSTNSFKRLVEGYEAPVHLFFSLANRAAAIRVPRYAAGSLDQRIEYRPPDFTGNVYLTLAAMLLAGIDGIQAKIDPGRRNFGPFDVDVARQDDSFRAGIIPLPTSLADALAALADDHEYLCRGKVFGETLIQEWITTRRSTDARAVAERPHPYEYELYLDT